MSVLYKRKIPLAIFTILCLFLIFNYYLGTPATDRIQSDILKYGITISAFALVLGTYNIVKIHVGAIRKRSVYYWPLSAWMLVTMVFTAGIGIIYGQSHPWYNWIYTNLQVPMGATMYAVIAFYCMSAAYRAFRARTKESVIFLLPAIFMLMWNAPIGEAIWPGFKTIGDWINNYPQITGYRAFWIGVGIAFITLTLRMMLGKETAFLGKESE